MYYRWTPGGKKGSQVWSNLYSFLPRSRNILDYVEILEFSLVDRKLNSNSNDNSSDPDGLKNSFWCVDYYSPLCLQVFGTLWNLCSNDLWRRFVITIWQLVIEVQDLVAGKECKHFTIQTPSDSRTIKQIYRLIFLGCNNTWQIFYQVLKFHAAFFFQEDQHIISALKQRYAAILVELSFTLASHITSIMYQ